MTAATAHDIAAPCNTCVNVASCPAGIWKQVYGDDGKVKDIFFYRQMSSDEQHTKVVTPALPS